MLSWVSVERSPVHFQKRVNREIFQGTLASMVRLEGRRGTIWVWEALPACEGVRCMVHLISPHWMEMGANEIVTGLKGIGLYLQGNILVIEWTVSWRDADTVRRLGW